MGFADSYLIEAGRSLLIVVDVQEPFLKTIFNRSEMLPNVHRLIAAAGICRVPVLGTTQNAEKLGGPVSSISELLPDLEVIDKMSFSCMGNEQFRAVVDGYSDRTQAVICGLETHVCINQTAHDLLDSGFVVHLAADAIGSRTEANYRYGLERLRHVGATISTTESIIFEWLRRAGTSEFRQAMQWIK